MSCQWHATILTLAEGWTPADSDTWPPPECWDELSPSDVSTRTSFPPQAGQPRGRFQFQPNARPSRLHFNRTAREAALGRSLPAGGDHLEGHVLYWDGWPLRFHVRNQSGETVVADFRPRGTIFTSQVLAGEELVAGPFYGAGGSAEAWVYGSSSVPSDVDVRVTEEVVADPGLDPWDFSLQTPATEII